MDSKLFSDVFEDSTFNKNVTAMLKKMYMQNRHFFQDEAVDFEDFSQEMWCELFEEKRFMPDRAWCMDAIKGNALNYIESMRAKLQDVEISEYIDGINARSDD